MWRKLQLAGVHFSAPVGSEAEASAAKGTCMTLNSHPTRAAASVLAGGIAAGTFDILYAWLFWKLKAGVSMQRILQSIAAGLLGNSSFSGGSATAALGFTLHYLIAITMALMYYLVARRWLVLVRRPLLCGAIYGLMLYGIMNYIVVPLSAAGPGPNDPLWITLSIAVHMVLIGIPIALATRRAYSLTSLRHTAL